MSTARGCRFPHLSWLGFPVSGDASGRPLVVDMQSVCHTISLVLAGSHDVRWITHGQETAWSEQPKTLHVFPPDGAYHTFVTNKPAGLAMAVLFLPQGHVRALADCEHVSAPAEFRRMLLGDDPILAKSVKALSGSAVGGDASLDVHDDELARRLILRLCELNGMAPPDWHDDVSVFGGRILEKLVTHVDEHLHDGASIAEMALLVGLSPSHFAKKFRHTTGLSLHRFINRRRVRRSLELLKTSPQPLDSMATDLGFSSQSHFTRVFSGLTGMTPAKYRKNFGPTVG